MRSNYKKLGPYIREVSEKNKNLQVTKLLGVSITKTFISSIANTVGTDMSTYKIVRTNQFAYGPVTSRNGEKISVALLQEDDCIISTSYTVFEISDHNELDPEYLMMWFRRPEFDRYARYKSHGSVREIFGWDEMCDVELPVPSIEKQREIVREYKTIINHIQLNEQMNQKLEETAQAIYKNWFVDFEFPISAEYAISIGKPELEGCPYKSSGGEMAFCKKLEQQIPADWSTINLGNFCDEMKSGSTPSRSNPEYWASQDIPWIKTGEVANCIIISSEEHISQAGYRNSSTNMIPINSVLIAMYGDGKTKGQVGFLKIEACTNQACCALICEQNNKAALLYYHLRCNEEKIKSYAIGGAQENLSKTLLERLPILEPGKSFKRDTPFYSIIEKQTHYTKENHLMRKLCAFLLSALATSEIKSLAA